MDTSEVKVSNDQFHDESEQGAAYERRIAEIKAVNDAELTQVSIDVHGAATTVLGVMKKVAPFREAMVALEPVDRRLVDGLEDYALAALEANARYEMASLPHEDITALNDEAVKLRDLLRADTISLAKRGLVDPAKLSQFKNLVGYRNVASDLIEYAVLLGNNWTKIQGKTPITEAELQHVKALGDRLTRAAGEREQSPVVVAETADIRQRALTLMLRAYDEVRRGISFLRWREGDADTIAPSVYAGRGGRPKAVDPGTADATTLVGGTTAPVAAPATAGASSTSSGAAAPIPQGLPGASPFTH